MIESNLLQGKNYKEKNMTRLKVAHYTLAILLLAPLVGMSQTAILVDPSVVESPAVGADLEVGIKISQGNNAVSYTHLPLPTICRV